MGIKKIRTPMSEDLLDSMGIDPSTENLSEAMEANDSVEDVKRERQKPKTPIIEYNGELSPYQRKEINKILNGKGSRRHQTKAVAKLVAKFEAERVQKEKEVKEAMNRDIQKARDLMNGGKPVQK